MKVELDKITVDKVSFSYRSDDTDGNAGMKKALNSVSAEIERGSYVAILGPNGSGKSTLAKIIDILELPDEGRVVIFGKDAGEDENFWDIRKKCACVFQNPDNQIVGTIVEEDTAFGPENLGVPNPELRHRVEEALKDVGIYELREREAASLSGGQKQKLAIAGALAMHPDVLILDEATAMLDPVSRDEFLEIVERQRKEKSLTIITITHDMTEAIRCEKIYVINKGEIAISGSPQEVFSSGRVGSCGLKQPENYALCYQIARICGEEILPADLASDDTLLECVMRMVPRMVSSFVPAEDSAVTDLSGEVILSIKHLSCSYDGGQNKAIDDVNLDVYRGEVFGIVGRSGCGKTTLVSHLNAILAPQSGEIIIHGKDGILSAGERKDKAKIRRTVGLVFQYPEYQLFEETVYKDISYGLRNLKIPETERRAKVEAAAGLMGIDAEILGKSPFELSGGQKRRVAMAGVLVMEPEILVLDEPASGLDPKGRDEMFRLIAKLRDNGTTVILVSHNMDEAAQNCDRICAIKDGRVQVVAAPAELFADRGNAESMGLDIPKLTQFSNRVKEKLGREIANVNFSEPAFESASEAARIVLAVKKAVKGNA
ncbi:MAG: energy-coupling factor transporter ATPase [Saccharofermentans sp.]|nr:energy-coupling factor transporter ATPase [Mageeibacillus sp.]MCI1264485.1 energy-coupling factor transporter ATPase [Saccharofermentans sp.]MCI1275558.1 energy-coupling factor transporter ATPase [Saccharofermentans sp.]MCI1768847.1 energy-coupling factor transporter ATPase [Mageeibacillus sp.]